MGPFNVQNSDRNIITNSDIFFDFPCQNKHYFSPIKLKNFILRLSKNYFIVLIMYYSKQPYYYVCVKRTTKRLISSCVSGFDMKSSKPPAKHFSFVPLLSV